MRADRNILWRIAAAPARVVVQQPVLLVALAVLLAPDLWHYWHWDKMGQEWGTYRQLRLWRFVGITLLESYVLAAAVTAVGRRWFKVAVYALALAAFGVYHFIQVNFNTRFSPELAVILGETTGSESSEFVRTYLLAPGSVAACCRTLLAAGAALMLELAYRPPRLGSKALACCSVPVVALLCWTLTCTPAVTRMMATRSMVTLEKDHNFMMGGWGTDALSNALYTQHTLWLTGSEMSQVVSRTVAAVEQRQATLLATAPDSLDIVVVVGESYNKHHAGIYGYGLPTTPVMQRERQAGNLVAFADVVSPYNTTSITLKNFFSSGSLALGQRWWQHPMWPALFKSAGYDVWFWDNQVDFMADASFTFALNGILFHKQVTRHCYTATNTATSKWDEGLVADLQRHITPGARRLVLLHLMGQHMNYGSRYPKQWERFTADSIARSEPWLTPKMRATIAQYDNATRYNDHVLGLVFQAFAHRPAIVVYLSDHGEEVYDYRPYMGRDHNIVKTPQLLRNQNEIPMVVWLSPVLQAQDPGLVSRLGAAASLPLLCDDVPHMLMGIAGLATSHYQLQRDALSPSFTPTKRPVYGNSRYEDIMSQP